MRFLHTFLPGFRALVCMQCRAEGWPIQRTKWMTFLIRLWRPMVPWFLHWNVGAWEKCFPLVINDAEPTSHEGWKKYLSIIIHYPSTSIDYPQYLSAFSIGSFQKSASSKWFPLLLCLYVAISDKSFRRTFREIMSENELCPVSRALQEVLILWAMEMSAG